MQGNSHGTRRARALAREHSPGRELFSPASAACRTWRCASGSRRAENRWLREALENAVAFIYFLGIAPGIYRALIPSFVLGWDPRTLKARIAFSAEDESELSPPQTAAERRYALRQVKQRLHQASFREAVITAYRGRCALSGLREPVLLDAAHIIEDKHEQLGQPVVQNGIPLAKTHRKTRPARRDNRITSCAPWMTPKQRPPTTSFPSAGAAHSLNAKRCPAASCSRA
jgi:hypothetical protein